MKKVKMLKNWGIYELNAREMEDYCFKYAVIHPEVMEAYSTTGLTPHDSDMPCDTLEQAENWINHY